MDRGTTKKYICIAQANVGMHKVTLHEGLQFVGRSQLYVATAGLQVGVTVQIKPTTFDSSSCISQCFC